MMTVSEVSKLTGNSVRTLHYYDEIGLLKPTEVTEAGYRLYDDDALARLQTIMMFRELEFSLKDIGRIIDSPDFDRQKALEQQIELLRLRKERLEQLIEHALELQKKGVKEMDFRAFDKSRLDEYERKAKDMWGDTEAYREYEKKTEGYTGDMMEKTAVDMMKIFAEFGKIQDRSPYSAEAQELVRKLQAFITDNYYTCTDQILAGLGQMYAAGGEMTDNIDVAGGSGTACFAAEAIRVYVNK